MAIGYFLEKTHPKSLVVVRVETSLNNSLHIYRAKNSYIVGKFQINPHSILKLELM